MTDSTKSNAPLLQRFTGNNPAVFVVLWLITVAVYLPAVKAGWVLDAAGWLWNIRTLKFWDYINNAQSGIPSLYQFTQFTTYIFYRLFNANPYAWYMLMVSMQAANSYLFFLLCCRLFADSGIRGGRAIAFAGVVLFTVCPHISEVVVWKAAYHYLQGFLLILIVLLCVQRYFHVQKPKYAWIAGVVYFCSTYSLEVFYITPLLTLTLALYYRHALAYGPNVYRSLLYRFFIPQLCMAALQIILLTVVYHGNFAHIGPNVWQPLSNYFCKPPRYIFHILFFGRFFPNDVRQQVYQAAGGIAALIVFYNIFVLVCLHIISRFQSMSNKGKACSLLFVWIIFFQAITLPLAFPTLLLVNFDRYSYFLDAGIYMLMALLTSYIPLKLVNCVLFGLYTATNVYFTIRLNLLWKHSAYIVNRLLKDFPDPGNKTVILLNVPQNMKGIPMIGAESDGEFSLMYKMFVNRNFNAKVYDASGYNMQSDKDGAHVTVYGDTLVTVTLNQWGAWWWYDGQGATSIDNKDFRLDMIDMGHWYNLVLKRPADQYLLLFQKQERWIVVDMKNRNGEAQW